MIRFMAEVCRLARNNDAWQPLPKHAFLKKVSAKVIGIAAKQRLPLNLEGPAQ
jgi:hypothetical protein